MAALDNLRILDLTQYEAGTSCTQALAWLGADVVKVEAPDVGDPGRGVGLSDETRYSAYFCNWNANKRSIVINLRKPTGRALLLEMVPKFDIFVENFGPGVVERLQIDYEDLRAVHPSLIYARLKGFGTSGPYAGFKSFDMVAQAAAGAFSVTGEAEGPPIVPGPTTGDSGTGVQLAMSILAAYIQREREGIGQLIEISMQEAMTYYMRTRIATGSKWGTRPTRRTGNFQGLPPVNSFPCKPFGPNDYIYLMPITAGHWDDLCTAIERPDLVVDERFAEPRARVQFASALNSIIEGWLADKTKHEAMRILGSAGVPCSAVLDTQELHNDEHLKARGFIKELDHHGHGRTKLLGFAPRMSESEVTIQRAPLLGEHTDEILRDMNLSSEKIEQLRADGSIQ